MPRNRAVQPMILPGAPGLPSVAVTTCRAAAESHMPCTMGDSRPASRAAVRSVWIGLWSPETTAKGRMSAGAVTVTSAAAARVSVALTDTCPGPNRVGQIAPVRPRMAKRSSGTASTVPAVSPTIDGHRDDAPTSVS